MSGLVSLVGRPGERKNGPAPDATTCYSVTSSRATMGSVQMVVLGGSECQLWMGMGHWEPKQPPGRSLSPATSQKVTVLLMPTPSMPTIKSKPQGKPLCSSSTPR